LTSAWSHVETAAAPPALPVPEATFALRPDKDTEVWLRNLGDRQLALRKRPIDDLDHAELMVLTASHLATQR
jgi:hypothetical protein